MKRVIPLAWSCILAALAGALVGYVKGRDAALVSEFKVYAWNLTYLRHFDERHHSADLREFLKGRYYYLANRIPQRWLQGAAEDYGQVSTNGTGSLSVGKGPTTAQEEYRKFKEHAVLH